MFITSIPSHKQTKPAETTLDAQMNPGQISFSKMLGLLLKKGVCFFMY